MCKWDRQPDVRWWIVVREVSGHCALWAAVRANIPPAAGLHQKTAHPRGSLIIPNFAIRVGIAGPGDNMRSTCIIKGVMTGCEADILIYSCLDGVVTLVRLLDMCIILMMSSMEIYIYHIPSEQTRAQFIPGQIRWHVCDVLRTIGMRYEIECRIWIYYSKQ